MHDGATGADVGDDGEAGDAGTGGRSTAAGAEAGGRSSARHVTRRLADWWVGLDRGWQAAALGVVVVLGHVLVRVA